MRDIEIDKLIQELNQKLLTIHHKDGVYPDFELISLLKDIFKMNLFLKLLRVS